MSLIDMGRMIRPWYRGGDLNGDHIFRDCEQLAEEGESLEGIGWLDPYGTDVCDECAERYDPETFAERQAWGEEDYVDD